MKDLTRKEINFLLTMVESSFNGGFKSRDIELPGSFLSETESYFLKQKLENIRNEK